MILEWKKGDRYYTETQCGRYTVSAWGIGDGWVYVASRIGRPMWKFMGSFDDAASAKRACQEFEDAAAVAQ